ncbi:LacI family transcriptional regulator [Occultella glacieicola]|uniref:LacI family transcriptional regulator n=1 Tax=Occultella glacieicola TaxID=2518684 RepID=A0ABY2E2C9_9MICO|nr:LacI family DNA-binding transcriptional regulator [Occultella glacieicola]TDE91666.1 LacI family transcriptional regulator [Occultella glacieicola]
MASVTLSDVAREAGVSLATASRAINGSANRTVRPELRDRVLAAAAALHYSPDANAQAMARGRTTTLGLIVHDIADPYFSSIAAGVTTAAERAGLMVTLASTGHDPEREIAFIEVLQSQRARAIVMAGSRIEDETVNDRLRAALSAYRAGGGAVAMIGQPLFDVDTVAIENTAGAADLAVALHAAGYRRFAALAGPAGHLTARDRMEGFAAGLASRGAALAPEHIMRSAFTRDGGYEGMRELLDSGAAVDVVLAVNDVMAVGAMAAARDAGVTVGTGIGIAGFDDIVTLRDVTPSLTTVRVPLLQVGATATELTLGEPAAEPRLERVASTVVLRDSTPPRA